MFWTPSSSLADKLFTSSNLLLIVALTATVIGTVGSVWMANVREGYLRRELAKAGEEAAKANEAAGNANERAALLQDTANKSERELEGERSARLLLEAKIAPRSLDSDAQEAVRDALLGFSGLKVSVTTYALDAEARIFAKQLIDCLIAAGINVDDETASVLPFGSFETGIIVSGPNQTLTRLIANILVGASGVEVMLDTQAPSPVDPANPAAPSIPAASILVGIKRVPTIPIKR